MLRYGLRRLYVALIGMMLVTLPLFAVLRVESRPQPYCGEPPRHCDLIDISVKHSPMPSGLQFSHVWRGGVPPKDYWPLALVLLAAGGAMPVFSLLGWRRRTATIG